MGESEKGGSKARARGKQQQQQQQHHHQPAPPRSQSPTSPNSQFANRLTSHMSLFLICEVNRRRDFTPLTSPRVVQTTACARTIWLSATITPERHGTIGILSLGVWHLMSAEIVALRPLPQYRWGSGSQGGKEGAPSPVTKWIPTSNTNPR